MRGGTGRTKNTQARSDSCAEHVTPSKGVATAVRLRFTRFDSWHGHEGWWCACAYSRGTKGRNRPALSTGDGTTRLHHQPDPTEKGPRMDPIQTQLLINQVLDAFWWLLPPHILDVIAFV